MHGKGESASMNLGSTKLWESIWEVVRVRVHSPKIHWLVLWAVHVHVDGVLRFVPLGG